MVLALLAVQGSQAARTESAASWTFMVYMDADNNLDPYAYYSLGLMEQVGSTRSVNVIVLWDGLYQPAYMYKVNKGELYLVEGFELNGVEVNMGDPSTLKTFVGFTVGQFKADHYVLVLWDHGNDVSGVCWDDTSNDHLTHPEVAAALSKWHIDVLAFDACLMAMVEVAYHTILEDLNVNPAMSELDAATMIVQNYVEFYMPRAHWNGGVMGGTLSAIDIDKIDEVVADLAVMTKALMVNMEANHDMISAARGEGNLPWSEYGWDLYIDLPTFVENITLTTTHRKIKAAGNAVLKSLSQAIVALGNNEPMESAGARGMGIWFPSSYHMLWGLEPYTATRFAARGWLDFLYAYWNDYHG